MTLRGGSRAVARTRPIPVVQVINRLSWNGTFDGRFLEKDYALEVSRRHKRGRQAQGPRLPPARLRHRRGGWEPLCSFLGAPVPNGSMPHLNDTASFRSMFGMLALTA